MKKEIIYIPTNISIDEWKKIGKLKSCNLSSSNYVIKSNFKTDKDTEDEIFDRIKNPKGIITLQFNEIPDNVKSFF